MLNREQEDEVPIAIGSDARQLRGLRQLLSKEQEDERSDATKMIVAIQPGK